MLSLGKVLAATTSSSQPNLHLPAGNQLSLRISHILNPFYAGQITKPDAAVVDIVRLIENEFNDLFTDLGNCKVFALGFSEQKSLKIVIGIWNWSQVISNIGVNVGQYLTHINDHVKVQIVFFNSPHLTEYRVSPLKWRWD